MQKSIDIALNKFDPIPFLLRTNPSIYQGMSDIKINLARLYHHYYLDNYGQAPPNPDPAQFEYLRFLAHSSDFRFRSGGLGISTGSRRHRSNEMGQAFFRYFLHDFLKITFFAHMDHVLNKGYQSSLRNVKVERCDAGDVPDYLCANSIQDLFIGEAKGRYTSISFQNAAFKKWRDQFSRITVLDSNNTALSLKGFIVGTRFVTEDNRASLRSKISAEDPFSPGIREYNSESLQPLGAQES